MDGVNIYIEGTAASFECSLERAEGKLREIAAAIEALPPRLQRKLKREGGEALHSWYVEQEAERARDVLSIYGNWRDYLAPPKVGAFDFAKPRGPAPRTGL